MLVSSQLTPVRAPQVHKHWAGGAVGDTYPSNAMFGYDDGHAGGISVGGPPA
jgi:hypothetical protein